MTDWTQHRRAQTCIAQNYLTNSKRPESLVRGIFPTHLARGRGCHVFDHQGKKYLDFICGLGTSLLGHAHPRVNAAMLDAMTAGASLSLGTHFELDTAEKLKELLPFIDAVKFLKTGSEACSAAVRIARAKTKRNIVLSAGYHGWADGFAGLQHPSIGIPEVTLGDGDWPFLELTPGYTQMERWKRREVAAVIVEPVITDHSQARVEWLRELREECTKAGVILIFDEIISGFRFPSYSVASHFGVTPDLICLGKAIANGMPLAAVCGKYDVMNCDEYFVSSTYAGEIVSLAAAHETMSLLQTQYQIDWLWANGAQFLETFNSLWPEKLWIDGYPSRGALKGDAEVRAIFMQEACKSGVLFGPSWFLSFPAIEELKNVTTTIMAIVARIKLGAAKLEGEVPKSPFAERMRS